MKKTTILSFATALCGLLASVASAQFYYGDSVTVGSGWMRTYVQYNSGAPSRIGIQMSEDAFNAFSSLPGSANMLSLPTQAPAPFNHVMVDWNPEGHPGPGYNAPHFDFHFYFSSPEEVAAIPFDPAPAPVDPMWVASDYAPDAVVVPAMGQHYLDLLSPEFNGGPFTKTFIYGYYQGQMTFLEPMITYATLQSGGSESAAIRQPSAFQASGYYPTEYGFSHGDRVYDVYLGGLNFAASPVPEPSTYGLLGAAALGALVLIRRRARAIKA